MKTVGSTLALIVLTLFIPSAHAQSAAMNNLYQLKDAQTRSISPENFSGEKGKGGMATLEEGNARRAARDLGQGWKVNPYVHIESGKTFTLGEIDGEGIVNHIWMTPVGDYRLMILRIYWDGETEPSVQAPVGDFFASGWGMGNEPRITSLAVCVNPRSGLNAYWQMPFRKHCKITMENMGDQNATVYYQIDYSLESVARDTPYFHAQFRRVNPLPFKDVYTIVDGIQGRGHYVGTYLAHGARSEGWWGEGEIKFFIDGDSEFPTICGTGEEDYFCGSYGYNEHQENGRDAYDNFTSPYTGFYHVKYEGTERRFGEYRWHIADPVRFEKDLRVTIQSLGWQSEGRYLPLEDDLASVAYWYQLEPHHAFPPLPAKEALVIRNEMPLRGFAARNVFTGKAEVRIQGGTDVKEIRYTLDNSDPTAASTLYANPFTISQNTTVKARGFANGKALTPILQGEFLEQTPLKAVEVKDATPGLACALHKLEETPESTKVLQGRKADAESVAASVALPTEATPEKFGLVFTGYLKVPAEGVYTFWVTSNDGSKLFVGGKEVVDNDEPHSARERSGQIALAAGLHPLRVEYFQAGSGKALEASIEGPGLSKVPLAGDLLLH